MKTRPVLTLLAVAASTALLVGCGGNAGPGSTSEPEGPTSDGLTSEEAADDLTGTLTVYAAASLQVAFDDLLAQFAEAHPGVDVRPAVYDGSSTLVTQLSEGAVADVFASAAEANMEDLVATGLNDGEPQLFATNTLVIAVPEGNPAGVADLADLDDLTYAVCAPEVPCGAATGTLFEAAGIALDAISQEQNVTAVAERVLNGDVDAGLVYATDVASREGHLDAVIPAAAVDIVNRYPITTLVDAQPTGAAFVDFVLSEVGQSVLAGYGFGTP